MSGTAIILEPHEFDQLRNDIRQQITKEVNALKGVLVEQPMHPKDIATWLGLKPDTIYKKMRRGSIKFHTDDDGSYWFFPSEVVEHIKRKK